MKKLFVVLIGLGLLMAQGAMAQTTTFAIKAYSKPYIGSSVSSSEWVMDVKITTPINCNGTNTNSIKIRTGINNDANNSYGLYATTNGNYDIPGAVNSQFIIISEIISAAKNGYLIEASGTLSMQSGKCEVSNYLIYVQ